jgi:hypothetical protein
MYEEKEQAAEERRKKFEKKQQRKLHEAHNKAEIKAKKIEEVQVSLM